MFITVKNVTTEVDKLQFKENKNSSVLILFGKDFDTHIVVKHNNRYSYELAKANEQAITWLKKFPLNLSDKVYNINEMIKTMKNKNTIYGQYMRFEIQVHRHVGV